MNYYDTLEVNQKASKEVVKAAYKSLMQRYHPDRNPDNAEIAERASLVVQAYEVISDPDKRAAYDIQLESQFAVRMPNSEGWRSDIKATHPFVKSVAPNDSKALWYIFLIIAVILLSGWLILTLSKNNQSPVLELKEIRLALEKNQLTQSQVQAKLLRIDEIFKNHPELLKNEAIETARNEAGRTIPLFINDLTINLQGVDNFLLAPDKPLGESNNSLKSYGHVLSIPQLFNKHAF